MYFQMLNPGLLLMTSVETYILLVMYFTIENPDMKMVEEIIKNRNIANNTNENKTIFIYNIVQNLRKSLINIRLFMKSYNEKSDSINQKKCLSNIEKEITKVDLIINNILDISNLNSEKITVYKNNYDIKSLIKQLQIKYNRIVSKNIKFSVNVSDDIPNYLYGDVLRIKQIINAILDNSLKYTKNGFIDLTVYSIIKKDVCRLLITIEDSGIGMTLEESIDILKNSNSNFDIAKELDKSNANLSTVKKIVDYIGGTMLLISDKDSGTKITIILDQKIPEIKDNFEYNNVISERKNIYIIDNNYKFLRTKINKRLYENNIISMYASTWS